MIHGGGRRMLLRIRRDIGKRTIITLGGWMSTWMTLVEEGGIRMDMIWIVLMIYIIGIHNHVIETTGEVDTRRTIMNETV
jgi:hypothetical protein